MFSRRIWRCCEDAIKIDTVYTPEELFFTYPFVQCFNFIACSQFGKNVLKVLFHRFSTYAQLVRYHFVRQSLFHQFHYFLFSLSKQNFLFQTLFFFITVSLKGPGKCIHVKSGPDTQHHSVCLELHE